MNKHELRRRLIEIRGGCEPERLAKYAERAHVASLTPWRPKKTWQLNAAGVALLRELELAEVKK